MMVGAVHAVLSSRTMDGRTPGVPKCHALFIFEQKWLRPELKIGPDRNGRWRDGS